ncbi:hypothetical protein [Acaryochloris sp. IP29b_bin.148]|uniref:hypothetical protein n=1 Tax=Acaryochloris sp. IP29b_bin.148 TaxID=2969218 RepID=UPI0026103FFE|nr:hypothetical protein [Acaryochloris sp. IP29b_bin.148]
MMSHNNNYQQFLPEDHSDDPMILEVPADPQPPYQEKIPSGYDPMGDIYLRGRAYRGLAGGRIPWWVLISGWIMFGGMFLMVFMPMVTAAAWELIPILIIISLPIIILWRGTAAKLAARKYKRR